jgi:hypothetical protein
MEPPQHPERAASELTLPPLDVKQAAAARRPHSPAVLHSPPASRAPTSRGSGASYTHRPVTAGASRLSHQTHAYHLSDPFAHQYARPILHETSLGIAYTHYATSRAEPVPIGNRDIIVGPAEERLSSSPTAGAASKLFSSMRRTLSLKKTQPVSLFSLEFIPLRTPVQFPCLRLND